MHFFRPEYPLVAFEINSTALTMVRLVREGKELRLEDFSVSPLEPGEISISMVEENLTGGEARLTELIRRAAGRSGGGKSDQVSVVLPDSTAKVSVLEMESAPRNRKEMDRLIAWQLKKVTPFPIEEGQVGYHRFGRPADAVGDAQAIRVLVTIMRKAVLRQYERCFNGAGLHPGLVDISTNNLYNLFHDRLSAGGENGDCMLVNCEDEGLSLVMLHGGVPILYRTKAMDASASGDEYDYSRVIREIRTSVLYYKEKLERQGPGRVLVRGTGFHVRGLRDQLAAEMDVQVDVLDPAGAIPVRAGLSLEPGMLQRLAPAIGAAIGR